MARRKKKATQPSRTHGIVIMDKSGSMSIRQEETRTGFNEFLQQLKKDAQGEYLLTLVQFDTAKRALYSSKPLSEVNELGPADYIPNGMTALFDAVGEGIRRVEAQVRQGDNV